MAPRLQRHGRHAGPPGDGQRAELSVQPGAEAVSWHCVGLQARPTLPPGLLLHRHDLRTPQLRRAVWAPFVLGQ